MNAIPTTVQFTKGLHLFIIHPLQLFISLRPNRRPNGDDMMFEDKDTLARVCFCLVFVQTWLSRAVATIPIEK